VKIKGARVPELSLGKKMTPSKKGKKRTISEKEKGGLLLWQAGRCAGWFKRKRSEGGNRGSFAITGTDLLRKRKKIHLTGERGGDLTFQR